MTRGLWRIPEDQPKNKEPLLCVLPPAAVGILQRRADENAALPAEDQSPYVFPGKGRAGHVTDPKKPWMDLLKRAGIENLRRHDLRRTLGSWQAASGASLCIIGRSLGHKNVATTAVYSRLDLDPVRASVNTAADAIMAAANGHAPKKALPAPADNGKPRPGKAKAKAADAGMAKTTSQSS